MTSDNDIHHLRQVTFARMVQHFSPYYPLYERNGQRYPVVIFPPTADQQNVDSVLGTQAEDFEPPEQFAFYATEHLRALQAAGRRMENKPTYSFARLQTMPLKIHTRLGRYFDMLATCDALEYEARQCFQSREPGDSACPLPFRTRLHEQITPEAALYNGTGRSATIGVATLTVVNHAETYKVVLARRSQLTATEPGFYHVMPAFVFQPTHTDPAPPAEYSVRYQVYREFLEEFFGAKEGAAPHMVEQHPEWQALQQMGAASLHLTGISFNVLTQRHEICTLLLIHNAEWYSRVTGMRAAWETEQRSLVFAPLTTDTELLAALPPALYANMTPQGSAALWLGVDYARALLQQGEYTL